jgi:hypothetical protein
MSVEPSHLGLEAPQVANLATASMGTLFPVTSSSIGKTRHLRVAGGSFFVWRFPPGAREAFRPSVTFSESPGGTRRLESSCGK